MPTAVRAIESGMDRMKQRRLHAFRNRLDDYRSLVERLATDEPLDDDQADRLITAMEAFGATQADVEADIALLKRIASNQRELNDYDERMAELSQIQIDATTEINAAKKAILMADKRHQEARGTAYALSTLKGQIDQAMAQCPRMFGEPDNVIERINEKPNNEPTFVPPPLMTR